MNESRDELARRYRGGTRSATCRRWIVGAGGAMVAALTAVQVAAAPGRSMQRGPLDSATVWDSVFTLAQATRGESTYRATCASCHGDSLSGIDDAPALTGDWFHKTWEGRALSSLFNRISNDMPSDNPGTLAPPQVAELVAFVLRYNGYPAGAAALPTAADSIAHVLIAPKP